VSDFNGDDEKEVAEAQLGASVPLEKLRENDTTDAAHTTPHAMLALFPDANCLRCGSSRFWIELSRGAVDVVIGKKDVDRSRVDIICDNCGMVETHAASILINSAWKKLSEGGNEPQK
jgi:hypothetical protein